MEGRMYRASKGAQQDGEMQEVPGDLKVVGRNEPSWKWGGNQDFTY